MKKHSPNSSSAKTAAASPYYQGWPAGLLLMGLVFAVFYPALKNGFVLYDDPLYVTNNAQVQAGWSAANVAWAFHTGAAANWHPLTWLSHILDGQCYDLKPWGHHLTGVLFHAVNTGLLFFVLRQFKIAFWPAFFAAALFGVHPLRVESVAWVSERKDVLSLFFWLLTMGAYGKWGAEKAGRSFWTSGFYWLALVFFALGLMAKQILVTLPFVLLLLDFWPLGRVKVSVESEGKGMRSFHSPLSLSLLLEKIPFFLLAAGASAITMVVQKAGGAVNINFSLEARLENAVVSYARYLGKLFYPAHLAAFYPLPAHWPMLAVIAAAILLTGISVAVVVLRRSGPYLLVGWLWFIGTLLPVIGVIQVGSQAMADRYTYVSAIGLVIALAIGIAELAQRWRAQKLAALVAAVTVIACAAQTRRQITYWQNNETLFQHAIQVTGDTDIACEELGDYYLSLKNFDAALDAYTRSLAVNPHSDKTENSIGLIFDRRGQYDEALRHIELAVKINPNNPVAHKNRALVLSRKGRREEAVGEFEESLRLNPNDAKTWFEYGNLLGRLGRFDEAISRFQQGLKLQPNDAVAHNDLGASFDKKGQTDAALAEFALAVQLNPNQQKARSNLGQILARKGRRDEAREQLKAALALDPKDTMAAKQLQALDQTVPAK